MFRYLRIAILLAILVTVAGKQWLTSSRLSSWEKPLWVTIYPVLLEPDEPISGYVDGLRADSFEDINVFFKQQAARFGRQLETPAVFQLADPLSAMPPALPNEDSGLNVALWSLKMRWWVWRNGSQGDLVGDDIKMFVIYQKDNPFAPLERSVGIKNGSYGVVNAVASAREAAHNRVVIAHEILHILGAGDKYELNTGQPFAPDGLADPDQSPLYPQVHAEIMGGRIAVSDNRWLYPESLDFCVIGDKTAAEIGW